MKAENFQTRFKSVYSVFSVVANWLFVVNFLFSFLGICFFPGYPYNFRYLVIVFLILLCTTQFIYIYIKSRIKKNNYPINSINLKDYSYESCHAESSAGGTLLYISNHLSYKTRSDLCIYKSRKSESIFIEIANPKKKNWLWVAFIVILKWTWMNSVTTTSIIYSISYWRKIKQFSS